MADRVRIGLIGTSWWANIGYLPGLAAHPGADLVAICGRDRGRAEERARQYGIPRVSTDYRELIAGGDLDALAVVVPDDLHHPVVMAALDAGLHVLCEKPFAANAAQAREMYERAEVAGVIHMIHFTYRWFPAFRHLRDLVAEGYVGRPFHAEFRYLAGYARDGRYRWRYDARRANGVLGDLGSHLIDLARWCLGDITRVSAHLAAMVPCAGADGRPTDPANDTALLAVEFRDGTQGVIHASAVAFMAAQRQEVAFHGEAGALTAEVTMQASEVRGARGDDAQQRPLPIPAALWGDLPPASAAMALVEHGAGPRAFIDAILAGRPAAPTFYDGLKAQEVIDAALISHREGRWVAIGEVIGE